MRNLPLAPDSSEPTPLRSCGTEPIYAVEVSEELIRRVVRSFYLKVQADAELGPVFAKVVTDWEPHLVKMQDFWSSLTLRTGRYTGKTMQAHRRLEGLTVALFQRWLDLFMETAREEGTPEQAVYLHSLAHKMGQNMVRSFNLPAG